MLFSAESIASSPGERVEEEGAATQALLDRQGSMIGVTLCWPDRAACEATICRRQHQ